MRKYLDSVASKIDGKPVVGAEVRVFNTGTSTPAQLFTADNIAATVAQPVYTDGLGLFSFFIGDGTYDIQITANGASNKLVGIQIYDDAPQSLAVVVPAGQTPPTLNVTGAADGQAVVFSGGNLVPGAASTAVTTGTITAALGYTPATPASVALKANIASPALTGTPTAPTATAGTNTTQIATTAFVAAADTAAATANAATLAASTGGGLIGTKRASLLTAAEYRTLSAKVADRFDLRDMLGMDITGANDMASSVQAAIAQSTIDGATLWCPGGTIALGSPVTINNPAAIAGIGRAVGRQTLGGAFGAGASVFHIAHSGVGFICGSVTDTTPTDANLAAIFDGLLFRDIATKRTQPAPVTGQPWTPNDHGYDFDLRGVGSVDMQHCLLLNPTRGINQGLQIGNGRLNMTQVYMHAFITGLNIEYSGDWNQFDDVRMYPFWSDHLAVNSFTTSNMTAVKLKYCDTPNFNNLKIINAFAAIKFSSNSFGRTTKANFVNTDIDRSTIGVWVDDTANNVSAQFLGLRVQGTGSSGHPTVPVNNNSMNIKIDGNGTFMDVVGLSFGGASRQAVVVGKSGSVGNNLSLGGQVWALGWDALNTGVRAFRTEPSNGLRISETVRDSKAAGQKLLFEGSGYVSSPDRRSYTPTITSPGRTGFTATVISNNFVSWGSTVKAQYYVQINNPGSGPAAGNLTLTLPAAYPADGQGFGNGTGRGIVGTAIPVTVITSSDGLTIEVIRTDDPTQTFPASAAGDTFTFSVEYPYAGHRNPSG